MIKDTSQWLKNIEIHTKESQLKGAKIVIGIKSHNMNKQNVFCSFCFLHPILNFTIVDIKTIEWHLPISSFVHVLHVYSGRHDIINSVS